MLHSVTYKFSEDINTSFTLNEGEIQLLPSNAKRTLLSHEP